MPYPERPSPEPSQPGDPSELIQLLLVAIERVLRDHPAGVSELTLIKTLQAPPWRLLGPVDYSEPARLYPVHFLVFHALYRLRDQLAEQGESLTISPLNTKLCATEVIAGKGLPDAPDKLRAFYLDLSQYRMPEELITRMMDDFWAGRSGGRLDSTELLEAARTLGLDAVPERLDTVKRQFRRAVMKAHPDRGGDTRRIQALNEAFALLKAHFQATTSAV
ncbi:MAG: DNA-J related domain-containing protein [Marinobacter sp.]|uniref:DNA-J related domain-containing protein n=1 Tax=Marinobacter sp. TaxID=50741 RepID=UPI00299D8B53|nr:DNA-J related domain-containing protein [Marinobacter sp.]MDX1756583.1 DNA-J related domain-containing protein [Marinobacter sp.]